MSKICPNCNAMILEIRLMHLVTKKFEKEDSDEMQQM